MKETIDAVYENGLLRPLKKLSMIDGQRIRLVLERDDSDAETGRERSPLSAFAGCLKSSPRFSTDPLEAQKRLRDEWN